MFFNALCASMMAFGVFFVGNSIEAYSILHHGGDESDHEEKSPKEMGKKLANQFWRDVKHQRVHAYSELIAHDFKGLNESGPYNRNDQIEGLEGLSVTEFDIRHLSAAQYGDTLVFSYYFVAEGEGITSGPSIDVWQRVKGKWLLVSHSYVPFVLT